MITIPVAVALPTFEKQISFFQFQHLNVYGNNAKAIIPIIKYNFFNDTPVNKVDWDLKLPYKLVDSIFDYIDYKERWYIPINLFYAAKQVIESLNDHEVVEIIDADLVHLKQYPKQYDLIDYNSIIVDTTYENWHMHIANVDGANRHIISDYLCHNDNIYINGGFNVIGRVKTIKSIMNDIIEYSIKIAKDQKDNNHGWWCAMYGLNIACHNNHIKMISEQNCYYPSLNKLEDKHYIAHYSVDKIFNKHKIPNVSINEFPNNLFYNKAKEWLEYKYGLTT